MTTLQPRSQTEIQSQFLYSLKFSGKVYRKKESSYIRPARLGETVETRIGGVVETVASVKDKNSFIVCGKRVGERYILTAQNLRDSYLVESSKSIAHTLPHLHEAGFREYQPKRQVFAHRVTASDIEWLQHGHIDKQAYFMASWGEPMLVEAGDLLVSQCHGGNDEIYRVERNIFSETYEQVEAPMISFGLSNSIVSQ